MDRSEDRRRLGANLELQDAYDTRQAKQRASIKWLLSKAYNNKVPENIREPFYRDHEDQEHLKPQIVHSLANAELYCLGLSNIYSDPNYNNLNHWAIIQALARKGVFVSEPPDAQLTETVLIQTTPLKLSAHMAVIEAMMVLYAKEVVTPDRVIAAIQRFSHDRDAGEMKLPTDHEEGLILWMRHATLALQRRIHQELEHGIAEGEHQHVPEFPPVRELKDLCDGVSLAGLVSFYCPEELPWSDIVVSPLPKISDSVQNLMLVYNFCSRCLPSSVFHMMPEDVTYLQASMRQNLIVFLADLFNVLEIHPVKCVRFPGTDKSSYLKEVYPRNSQGVAHKRSFPQSISAIPDLRSNLGAHSSSFTVSKSSPTIQASYTLKKSYSLPQNDIQTKGSTDNLEKTTMQEERRGEGEEQFVVHRGRGIPTLSAVALSGHSQSQDEPLIPARLRPSKERTNQDSKADERGEPIAAGRPSNWEEQRRTSYAGRRSRRNSVSDDSQLTLENFGGSQENLQFLGRNPDKEPAVHTGRRTEHGVGAPAVPIRTSAQDARSSVELVLGDNVNGREKQDEEKPDTVDCAPPPTSFVEMSLRRSEMGNVGHGQRDEEKDSGRPQSTFNGTSSGSEKKTTFSALPNTTTWQQQSCTSQQQHSDTETNQEETSSNNHIMASQLHNIRMKLEEKRRRIESEKRRMELVMSKQRQKVGKAAFLQAVTKGKNTLVKTPESDSGKDSNGDMVENVAKPQRPYSLQEISEDVNSVEHKWLDNTAPYIEERKTPDIENMDMEQYQQSIAQMNSSLHELQADIQRLASQQHQMQDLVQHQQLQQQQLNQHHHQQQQQQQLHQQQQQQLHQQQQQQQHLQQQQQQQQQLMQQHHGQFFLHEQQFQNVPPLQTQPQPQPQPQRRTWAQQAPVLPPELVSYQESPQRSLWTDTTRYQQPTPLQLQQQLPTYPAPQLLGNMGGGFMLHETKHSMGHVTAYDGGGDSRYHNGEQGYHLHGSGGGFQLHQAEPSPISGMFMSTPMQQTASPQHRGGSGDAPSRGSLSLQQPPGDVVTLEKNKSPSVLHAPVPTPSVDDMEPQSISFIGAPSSADEGLAKNIKALHITSGSRTYRIPSPTRPTISHNSFQKHEPEELPQSKMASDIGISQPVDSGPEKGFYISFDGDTQPKRPKPPLRMKRSPKKERQVSQYENLVGEKEELRVNHSSQESCPLREQECKDKPRESERLKEVEEGSQGVGLVIGSELANPDPMTLDEMERKKERIMLLSLQRRQQQEEAKALKEQEAQRRREMEKLRQEERERKKEEERLRRAAILEQYKLKKAIEEAEREGKLLPEKVELSNMKPVPKMRNKSSASSRPRPKTIHVDSGSVDVQEGILSPSRSKKGSTSNLTDTVYSQNLRRDYYRGSQDSLTERFEERRGGPTSLFRDSPDDGRGASPCRSVNQLGRRGSYKTSRGSSTDQDSMVYRYTDTDSGLGRATPPRRAPSPGTSSMRHLPSPSGPGSLPPGLMTKRRIFDDGSSDVSSTPSSMMEYTGPRLYKQPATKSNRGIMLNAVEYCVFPGVVNKEAKRRVLEEIARSESKHFLILFRDAGCQFRALYSYCPDREEVLKLYGTGPKQVNDRMFDKFFKYNSGGKCFSQVHTKHLTVTIDAFTIHNSLWQGKKVALPNKKDMALVI